MCVGKRKEKTERKKLFGENTLFFVFVKIEDDDDNDADEERSSHQQSTHFYCTMYG